jgi:GMP synthase (glutamine-hydrolysing)
MRILAFDHVPTESLGTIETWASENGHTVVHHQWYGSADLPDLSTWDLLFVMGGPMNIYEDAKFPWLATEKAYLDKAIAAGKWMVGICLGSQLLADRLGGAVTRNREPEIGWHAIRRHLEADADPIFGALPQELEVMHWHGDTYATPPGAVLAYSSEACRNQAFRKDRVLGLQCHLELTPKSLEGLVAGFADEPAGKYVQNPEQFLSRRNAFAAVKERLFEMLDALEAEIAKD